MKLNWIEADLVDQLVGIGLYGLHRQDVIVRILDERLSMRDYSLDKTSSTAYIVTMEAEMERYEALTEEEVAEVRKYAERNGRSWKRELGFAWMNASEPGILQALRNSHGPGWLKYYRLPKVEGK